MKINFLKISILFTLLLLAGCTKEDLNISVKEQNHTGEFITLEVGSPDLGQAETRVSYDDTNLSFAWEEGDQLRLTGFDKEGRYLGKYTDFSLKKIENGKASFTGNLIEGATQYKVFYFPKSKDNIMKVDSETGDLKISYRQAKAQAADNSTAHLRSCLYLQGTHDGNKTLFTEQDLAKPFNLKMQCSIMKFKITNLPESIFRDLHHIEWTNYLNTVTLAESFNRQGNDLTLFLCFDPKTNKIDAGDNFHVEFYKHIEGTDFKRLSTVNITSPSGKTYEAGKRYTAEIDYAEYADLAKLKSGPDFYNNINMYSTQITFLPNATAEGSGKEVSHYTSKKKAHIDNSGKIVTTGEGFLFNKDCSQMFYGASRITSIIFENCYTDFTTKMSKMFCNCKALTSLDLSGFNTSKVTDMNRMFQSTNLSSLDVSSFNTSKVTDMNSMFAYSNLSSLDLSSFNTSQVTDMKQMFNNCKNLTQLKLGNTFTTEKVSSMSYMFNYCTKLSRLDLGKFTLSDQTDLNSMFWYLGSETSVGTNLILGSGFDMLETIHSKNKSKVSMMFYGARIQSITCTEKVKNFIIQNAEDLGITNPNDITFYTEKSHPSRAKLKSGEEINPIIKNIANGVHKITFKALCTDKVGVLVSTNDSEHPAYYDKETGTFTTDAREFLFNENCFSMFANVPVQTIDFTDCNTSQVTNMTYMFPYCTNLKSLDLSSFDTRNVTKMDRMFMGCMNLTEINLSSFNTERVTDMKAMFLNCNILASLNLENFNTKNVTDMNSMFKNCWRITNLTLGAQFVTDKVTDMSNMFEYTSTDRGLQILDLSSFNTSNIKGDKAKNIFGGFDTVQLILGEHFDLTACTTPAELFKGTEPDFARDLSNIEIIFCTEKMKKFLKESSDIEECLNPPIFRDINEYHK